MKALDGDYFVNEACHDVAREGFDRYGVPSLNEVVAYNVLSWRPLFHVGGFQAMVRSPVSTG